MHFSLPKKYYHKVEAPIEVEFDISTAGAISIVEKNHF